MGEGRRRTRRLPGSLVGRRSRKRQSDWCAPPNRAIRAATEPAGTRSARHGGSSDGGAHLLSSVGPTSTTRLSPSGTMLKFEQAVAGSVPFPRTAGSHDVASSLRGLLADILLIDRARARDAGNPALRARPAGGNRDGRLRREGNRSVMVNAACCCATANGPAGTQEAGVARNGPVADLGTTTATSSTTRSTHDRNRPRAGDDSTTAGRDRGHELAHAFDQIASGMEYGAAMSSRVGDSKREPAPRESSVGSGCALVERARTVGHVRP